LRFCLLLCASHGSKKSLLLRLLGIPACELLLLVIGDA
jgi:hypothetical protein